MVTESEKLELPYAVFQRGDSGSFAMRFTLPDRDDPDNKRSPQYRIGLKTTDWAEAHQRANIEYYRALGRHEEGFRVGPARFDKVAKSYVDTLLAEGKSNASKRKFAHARHAQGVVERYLIPFFKEASVGAIRKSKFDEYLAWRKTYWTEGPGKDIDFEEHVRGNSTIKMRFAKKEATDATIKREINFLRGIFKHAVDKGYIRSSEIPKLTLGKVATKTRPAFTREEFAKLETTAIERQYSAQKIEIETKDKAEYQKQLASKNRLIFERRQMVSFINIAVNTGMRPGELFNLKWRHIVGLDSISTDQLGDVDIRIFAEGKNKEGYVIPVRLTSGWFESLKEAYKERFGDFPTKDNPVFCDAFGNPIATLNTQLNQLLKAADLTNDIAGKKFSAYSFRHTYATWQLQKDNPIDIYTLAINMRTSIEMIQKHYSKLKAEQKADVLRGKPIGGG